VLPIGMSDLLRQSAAKVYCPHCREIYFPKSSRLECLDGAYFGTTFAHLFFLTYQHLVPLTMPTPYCPRIYGFKIHKSVKENLRRQREQVQKQMPALFAGTSTNAWSAGKPASAETGTVEASASRAQVTGSREEILVD
ncbi:unnamed protein product, partial [Polarella glacialis]